MWFFFGHCHSMCKRSIKNGIFPPIVWNVQMLDQYTKKDPFDKKNYRPVSRLTVYDRVIYEQASNYFQHFFNEILCGFREAHDA